MGGRSVEWYVILLFIQITKFIVCDFELIKDWWHFWKIYYLPLNTKQNSPLLEFDNCKSAFRGRKSLNPKFMMDRTSGHSKIYIFSSHKGSTIAVVWSVSDTSVNSFICLEESTTVQI